MTPYRPQKIYVEKKALGYPQTKRILERLADVPHETVENAQAFQRELKKRKDPIGAGKRCLFLALDRGRSFKPFPESLPYLSCDYYTLHVAEGCDLECSYCILQAYLTNPALTVYVNVEEMLETLETILRQHRDQFFRIGTGQLADSLSLDPITGFTEILVPFFARQENAVLELKTKSRWVDRLLALEPDGRTIVSWSLNSRRVQQAEEHKCAGIDERLEAARKVLAASPGYRVAFHLDPIIDYPGWEREYVEVLEALFTRVPEDRIAWISLGCLRFMPALKSIMQRRFPKSTLPLGEWSRGMDGKMRYFKPRRIEIYRTILAALRRLAPGVTVYLSMESPEVWHHVFGGEHSKASVCRLLDGAARKERMKPSAVGF